MAKLIFLLDGNVIKEFMLDRERMTIGRRPTSDIHIDNLAISGEHAVIVTTNQEVSIQDMNSTNGTLVNNQPVTKQVLSHGDTIGLGKYSLKFVNDGQVGPKHSDGFADTVMVAPNENTPANTEAVSSEEASAAPTEPAIVSEAPESQANDESHDEEKAVEATVESTTESIPPRLNILSGDRAGSELVLDKSMVKIGEPGRQVAVITKRKDGFYITHVSGDGFPLINGLSIGAQANVLNNHDVIEVLGVKMEVRLD